MSSFSSYSKYSFDLEDKKSISMLEYSYLMNKNHFIQLGGLMSKLLSKILMGTLVLATLAIAGPVSIHGSLKVSGNKIVDKNNEEFQLRGMSMFWSQWIEGAKYYNANVVNWLVDDWHVNVVRAALGVNGNTDGYLTNKGPEKAKIKAIIDAAIAKDIYVIVDWHSHANHSTEARAFFIEIATEYAGYDNIIYEIWNEPLGTWGGDVSKWNEIKTYADYVTTGIRTKDDNALVLVGTPYYSQNVNTAVSNPVADTNSAYVFHFYAGTHSNGGTEQKWVDYALGQGLAVFISEFGLSEADGGIANSSIYTSSTSSWLTWADARNLSYVNWSISDKSESSAALKNNASTAGNWDPNSDLTASGKWIRNWLRKYPKETGNGSSSSDAGSSSSDPGSSSSDAGSSSSVVGDGNTALWSPGYENNTFPGGYWYGSNDSEDGGTSVLSCAGTSLANGDSVDDCVTDTQVAAAFNITDVVEGAGTYGFAAIAAVLGQDEAENKLGFNLSSGTGITLTYTSSENMLMHIVDDGLALGWNTHRATLIAGTNVTRTLSWSEFVQAGDANGLYYGIEGAVSAVVANLKEIQFQAHSDNFTGASTFSISSIRINGVELADGRPVDNSSSSDAGSSSSDVASSSSDVASSSSDVASSSSVANSSSSAVESSSSIDLGGNTPLWSPGYENNTYPGGYWYGSNDSEDGGTSVLSCAGTTLANGDSVDECVTDTKVTTAFNITDVVEGAGTYGFAAIAVVLGQDEAENKIGFNLSSGTGITLTYTSSENMLMHIVDDGSALGWNTHRVTLIAGTNVTRTLTWAEFVQAGDANGLYYGTEGAVSAVVANLKEIQFQAHSDNFTGASTFSIGSIQIDGVELADGRPVDNSSSSVAGSSSSDVSSSSSDDVTGLAFNSLSGVDLKVTESQLVFDIAESEFYTIEVYSLLGAKETVIVNGYVNQGSLEYSTNELTKGVYIIRVSNDNGIKTFKLNLR